MRAFVGHGMVHDYLHKVWLGTVQYLLYRRYRHVRSLLEFEDGLRFARCLMPGKQRYSKFVCVRVR